MTYDKMFGHMKRNCNVWFIPLYFSCKNVIYVLIIDFLSFAILTFDFAANLCFLFGAKRPQAFRVSQFTQDNLIRI